jgi:glycosidase
MLKVYEYWLGFLGRNARGEPDGIDGFRLDMAHFINDKSFWNDAMPEVLRAQHAGRELLFLAECYGIGNNLDLFERGINAAYDDDFYKVAANLYGLDRGGRIRHRARGRPGRKRRLPRSLRGVLERRHRGGLRARAAELRGEAGAGAPYLARYSDNHDEGRGFYLYGPGATKAINQLVFLAPRTLPFILTGQEFGAVNRPPIHDRMNPIGKRRRIVNGDHVREQESVEFEGNSFARDPAERAALYRFFKALIKLRRSHRELSEGSFHLINADEDAPRAPTQRDRVRAPPGQPDPALRRQPRPATPRPQAGESLPRESPLRPTRPRHPARFLQHRGPTQDPCKIVGEAGCDQH